MNISVIIPTYNGAHKILNVLEAIQKQSLPDFEVLVVIDGSTDGTADLIRSRSFCPRKIRIIEQPNGGRARVRNRGAAEASGDLLVFFDDDMRPCPDAVRLHLDHHQKHHGSILTGGQIEEITGNMSDFLRFKAYLSRKWAKDLNNAEEALSEDKIFLTAANFSISAATFRSLGGFDDRLTDAEDYDLAVRAFRKGIELYADPNIRAWHDDLVTCTSYIRRLRQYAAAQEKLVRLKPDLYGSATKYTAPPPTGFKKFFFTGLCSKLLIRSIDIQFWSWLPRPLRYRLYDYVITANGCLFPEKVKL